MSLAKVTIVKNVRWQYVFKYYAVVWQHTMSSP